MNSELIKIRREIRDLEIVHQAMVDEYQRGETRKDNGFIEYTASSGIIGLALSVARFKEKVVEIGQGDRFVQIGILILLGLILWRVW